MQIILDEQVQQQFIENKSKQTLLATELEQLVCSATRAKKIVHHICILANLREFLRIRDESIYKQKSEKKFYEVLLKALAGKQVALSRMDFNNLPQKIKPVIITRLALTSYYALANARKILDVLNKQGNDHLNGLGLAELFKLGHWKFGTGDSTVRYSILLGRYDAVSFIPSRLPCRCRVSDFPNKDITERTEEKFATHFARREIALPMELYGNCDINDCNYTIYAISSVSLQRRSMRLNLIYRLLNARYRTDNKERFYENSIEENIRKIISKFGHNTGNNFIIKILLTDGWGDLLLVFMYKRHSSIDISELHEYLLKLQQALYEDFMIDRTELIYTPHCIDYMLKDPSKNYSFSLLFRFQEDRKLERSIQSFIDALHEKKYLLEDTYGVIC